LTISTGPKAIRAAWWANMDDDERAQERTPQQMGAGLCRRACVVNMDGAQSMTGISMYKALANEGD